ncbi:hypothetical protein GQ53DRAFT_822841 [Thozetella sp. PMI_491]|nr:hypothetical protein GQ53DRAFT_822841 [Thozetella sp. PMI_491]
MQVRDVVANGLSWDGSSCLVLITCALACLASPFSTVATLGSTTASTLGETAPPNASSLQFSLSSASVDREAAISYYGAAKRRLGLLEPSLLHVQLTCSYSMLGNYAIAFVGTFMSIAFIELAQPSNAGRWAQASLLLCWFFVYSTSIGPIAFAIGTEVSAVRLRSKTVSFGRGTYYALSIFNTIIAPYMLNTGSGNLKGKTAFLPGALTVLMLVWSWFRLPETKDLTPGTLDHLFNNEAPTRKFTKEAKKYQ